METKDHSQNDQGKASDNDAVSPGHESNESQPLKTRDDKRTHNIDANKSISQMRDEAEKEPGDKLEDQPGEQGNGPEDDALNYKSDRNHGTYNPEHI